jgi:hypothetical protein
MRMALKAQSQCRQTLETLATIKNPPVVFARQANIAQGPQQVNKCDDASASRGRGENRKAAEQTIGGAEWRTAGLWSAGRGSRQELRSALTEAIARGETLLRIVHLKSAP